MARTSVTIQSCPPSAVAGSTVIIVCRIANIEPYDPEGSLVKTVYPVFYWTGSFPALTWGRNPNSAVLSEADSYVDFTITFTMPNVTFQFGIGVYADEVYDADSGFLTISLGTVAQPNTPYGLQVTGDTPISITLWWGHTTPPAIQGLILQRAKDENFTVEKTVYPWGYVQPNVNGMYTFVDNTVQPDTLYWYKVLAYNEVDSPWTAPIFFKTDPDPSVPPPKPTVFYYTVSEPNLIVLKWEQPSTPAISGFVLWRARDESFTNEKVVFPFLPANQFQYRDKTVLPGTHYHYAIAAVNSVSVYSDWNIIPADTEPVYTILHKRVGDLITARITFNAVATGTMLAQRVLIGIALITKAWYNATKGVEVPPRVKKYIKSIRLVDFDTTNVLRYADLTGWMPTGFNAGQKVDVLVFAQQENTVLDNRSPFEKYKTITLKTDLFEVAGDNTGLAPFTGYPRGMTQSGFLSYCRAIPVTLALTDDDLNQAYYAYLEYGKLQGDVTGDGNINTFDINAVTLIMAGQPRPDGLWWTEAQKEAADVNLDGLINDADKTAINTIITTGTLYPEEVE
jgi:hypothetical protein